MAEKLKAIAAWCEACQSHEEAKKHHQFSSHGSPKVVSLPTTVAIDITYDVTSNIVNGFLPPPLLNMATSGMC